MARSGPGRASPGQVRTAVWRSSLDLREQPWGVGDESKGESCSPHIATSCWAAKAWCPLAERQATGGCARVGAPLFCAGAARRYFRGFLGLPLGCAAPGGTGVGFGSRANLVLGLVGLLWDCGPSEGCGPLTSGL